MPYLLSDAQVEDLRVTFGKLKALAEAAAGTPLFMLPDAQTGALETMLATMDIALESINDGMEYPINFGELIEGGAILGADQSGPQETGKSFS